MNSETIPSPIARHWQDNDAASNTTAAGFSPIALAERGWLPDALLRLGMRRLCAQRLREESAGGLESAWLRFQTLLQQLRTSPIAIETDAANAQHYELPPRFFELCLGRRLKYQFLLLAMKTPT